MFLQLHDFSFKIFYVQMEAIKFVLCKTTEQFFNSFLFIAIIKGI